MVKGNNKILYIGGFELPDHNAAAQRVIANGKLLRILGCDVKFLGVSKSLGTTRLEDSYKRYYDFDTWSIPYPSSFRDWINYATKIENVIKYIELIKFSPEVVIVYNFPALSSSKLIKYCRKNNIKIIGDITEWYDHKINSLLGIVKYIDSELRMRCYNKKLDGLICISKFLHEYYVDSVRNLIVLPPLVDIKDDKWKIDISPRNEKVIIVYAGSPSIKDRINKLIDGLLEINNIQNTIEFRVIGITAEKYYQLYSYHLKRKNDIEQFTRFFGRVSHSQSLKQVKNADFSAFIRDDIRSNKAGFPTKFVEAITCGTFVLTNKTSDLEEYLNEGLNGFWLEYDKSEQKLDIVSIKDKLLSYKGKKLEYDNNIFDYNNYYEKIKLFLNKIQVGLNDK